MARAKPQLSLKGRALRYLSQREHSRAELERKLAKHAEQPEEVARVLDELQARGFIDHQRVADSVVHRKAGKLGALRLKQELQSLGIEPALVAAALATVKATEWERARDVWRRRFDEPAKDAGDRARQARFLLARGFPGDIVSKVVSGGGEDL
ncbi:recombination regulator RecX [Ramlibacter sp. PS4R-6]|uniref:recombination regulator RecX n=1 Tax=Ramlibacter sp. PS4R-6 TaxID=3133438 RepID=UPI0030B11E94